MIRFHKVWLLICAVAGIPIAALSGLLIVAAIGVAVQKQAATVSDVMAILLFIATLCLFAWCIVLGLSLRGRAAIPDKIRPRLLAFYALSSIASVMAATSTYARNGSAGMIFGPAQAGFVVAFFIVPILVMWIERNRRANTASHGTALPRRP
jgi:hypothetical protein